MSYVCKTEKTCSRPLNIIMSNTIILFTVRRWATTTDDSIWKVETLWNTCLWLWRHYRVLPTISATGLGTLRVVGSSGQHCALVLVVAHRPCNLLPPLSICFVFFFSFSFFFSSRITFTHLKFYFYTLPL